MKNVRIWRFSGPYLTYIRTELGDLLYRSPYSERILENKDQKKLLIQILFTQFSCSYIPVFTPSMEL